MLALVGALALSATGCAWLARSSVPTGPPPGWLARGSSTGSPAISASGRYVAFSTTDGLTTNDTNASSDVYVRDNVGKTTELISTTPAGAVGAGASYAGGISDDGRYVAFSSTAADLTADDTDAVNDAFIRDRQTGTTTLVGLNNDASAITTAVSAMSLSGDGQTIALCLASALPVPACGDIAIRHVASGTTTVLPHLNGAAFGAFARLSFDGSRVAFGDFTLNGGPSTVSMAVANTTSGAILADLQTASFEFSGVGSVDLDLSGDGTTYAITESHGGNTATPTGTVTVGRIGSAAPPVVHHYGWTQSAHLSNDGSELALDTRIGLTLVIAIDEGADPFRVVSANARGDHIAAVDSTFDLSADGAWLAFSSTDAQITDAANNGYSNLYTRSVAPSPVPPT
jgi:hypothetical protein